MIVGEPNEFAGGIHDRMPIFLSDDQFARWLRGEAGAEVLAGTERLSATVAGIEAGQ
jgi:putative SOS response-associated peptidase YedK